MDKPIALLSPQGRSNRSIFQLSESGGNKDVVDSILFYIDGISSKGAESIKQDCAMKLLELFHICNGFHSNSLFKSRKLSSIILSGITTSILLQKVDDVTKCSLLFLMLLILMDESGSINPNVSLPLDAVPALVSCFREAKPAVCEHSNTVESSSTHIAVESINTTNIHKKRKFGTKSTGLPSSPCLNNQATITGDESNALRLAESMSFRYPSLSYFITGEVLLADFNDKSFFPKDARPQQFISKTGKVLALVILNRYLGMKSQITPVTSDLDEPDKDDLSSSSSSSSSSKCIEAPTTITNPSAYPLMSYQETFRKTYHNSLAISNLMLRETILEATILSCCQSLAECAALLQVDIETFHFPSHPLESYIHRQGNSFGDVPTNRLLQRKSYQHKNSSMSHFDRSQLWQLLFLLEVACYGSSENQDIIANYCPRISSAGTKSSFLELLITLINKLYPVVTHFWSCEYDNHVKLSVSSSTPFRSPIVAQTDVVTPNSSISVGRPDCRLGSQSPYKNHSPSCTSIRPEENRLADSKRLQNLFSELHSIDLETIFTSTFSTPTSVHSSCTEKSPIISCAIDYTDIWIGSIRIMVNLCHNCPTACQKMLTIDPIGLSNFVDSLLQIVAYRIKMNNLHTSNRKGLPNTSSQLPIASCDLSSTTTGYEVALTPEESLFDKSLFDSELYILTLLSNIVEAFSPCISDLKNLDLTQKIETVGLKSLFSHHRNIHDPSSVTESSQTITLVHVLLSMLLYETSTFMKDLEDTDDSLCSMMVPQNSIDNTLGCSPDAIKSLYRKKNHASNLVDRIPVSEIIISAHICLLLVAIAYPLSNQMGKDTMIISADPQIVQFLKSRLPRNSWWLLIRVLKAFLALQGQTGVLLVDNFGPILHSIKVLEKDNKQWPLLITDAGITFSVASRAEGVSASESSSDKQEDSRKTLSGPDWLTEMMKPNDCMSIASAAPKTEQQRRRIWKVNASATTNATTSLLLKELDSTSSEYLITDNGSCTPNRYQRSDSETPVRKPMIDQAVKSSKGRKFDPSADVFNLDKSLETKKPSSSSPSTAQSISTVIQSTKMKLIRDPIASSNQSKSPRDEKVQICSKSWFQDLDVNPVAVQDFTSPKKIFISNSKSSTPVSERKRIVSKTPTPSKSDNVIDERKGIEVSNYKEAIPSFLLKQETIKRYGKTSSRKQGDSLILLPTFRSPSPGKMSHKLHADSLDFTRESLQSLKQAAITSLVSVGDTIKLSTEQSSSTVLDQSTSWNSRRRFSTFRTMNKPVTDITTDTSSISSSRKYIPNDEFVFQDVDDL